MVGMRSMALREMPTKLALKFWSIKRQGMNLYLKGLMSNFESYVAWLRDVHPNHLCKAHWLYLKEIVEGRCQHMSFP